MSELNAEKLTNFQMELIKLFQMEISTDELKEIKSIISRYLAEKATKDFDELITKSGLNSEDVTNWQFEHKRIQPTFQFPENN